MISFELVFIYLLDVKKVKIYPRKLLKTHHICMICKGITSTFVHLSLARSLSLSLSLSLSFSLSLSLKGLFYVLFRHIQISKIMFLKGKWFKKMMLCNFNVNYFSMQKITKKKKKFYVSQIERKPDFCKYRIKDACLVAFVDIYTTSKN